MSKYVEENKNLKGGINMQLTKREQRLVRQAQIRAIKCTLGLITLYSLGFAGIVYMFMK